VGDTTNYKLPMIVDVAITLKFLQSKANTWGTGLYDFSDNPNKVKVTVNQQTTNNVTQNNQQPEANSNFTEKAADNTVSNPVVTTNTTKIAINKAITPPQYQFLVEDMRIFSNGNDEYRASVWADGKRILYRYFSTLAYTKDSVEKSLKQEAGTSGFYGEDNKAYPANPIYK